MRILTEESGRIFIRKRWRMSGVSRNAPIGVQLIQKLSSNCCPRLQYNRLRCYQASVLLLTFISYMTYHLTRKPISVVKNVLHQNCSALTPPPGTDPNDDQWCNWAPFNTTDANTLLGALDSAFLFSYAGAMFVSGMIAERVDLRYFLSLGMLTSAIFCYLFGLGKTYGIHSISYYLLVQVGAGIAQTTGWPGTVAILGKWFGNTKKGLIFGIWNCHTSIGNILGTIMATSFVESDWALSFMLPALAMGVAAALVWLLLASHPRQLGLQHVAQLAHQPAKSDEEDEIEDEESSVIVGDQSASLRPNRHSANAPPPEVSERSSLLRPSAEGSERAISLWQALRIPGVIEFSLSLFFAKLVSYTFLYWLPSYIRFSSGGLSARAAGELSTVFDVGGAAGGVLAGLLADASGCPAAVCALFYALGAPMLKAYEAYGAASYSSSVCLLLATGALVNGPYALITTAVSAELGASLTGSRAIATVTAIIDGTGSVGAALGPLLAGVGSSHSWDYVFLMLIVGNAMALFSLYRLVQAEVMRKIRDRRMTSPPRVRIE